MDFEWAKDVGVNFGSWAVTHIAAFLLGVVATVIIAFKVKSVLFGLVKLFGPSEVKDLIEKADELYKRIIEYERKEHKWNEERKNFEKELKKFKTKSRNLYSANKRLAQQIDHVEELDEHIWSRPIKGRFPAFTQRSSRKATIISLMNLKGGVGKTTLTGNLGFTLARNGHKVLCVDLDYQGSLTHLVTPSPTFSRIVHQKSFLENFLDKSEQDPLTFLQFTEQIFTAESNETGGVSIMGSAYGLADTEIRLLSQWIADYTNPKRLDARFHLRSVLHAPEIAQHFDFILLDCPPRMTTMCINALCASDYLLIPVTLDSISTEAVLRLLTWIEKRRGHLDSPLEYLGLIANRVVMHAGRLKKDHRQAWAELRDRADIIRQVYFFETNVPRSEEYGGSKEGNLPALTVHQNVFEQLTEEMKERLAESESGTVEDVGSKSDSVAPGERSEQKGV